MPQEIRQGDAGLLVVILASWRTRELLHKHGVQAGWIWTPADRIDLGSPESPRIVE
jgi:hypothetical protein